MGIQKQKRVKDMGWTPEELEEMRRADAQIEGELRQKNREKYRVRYAKNREKEKQRVRDWQRKNREGYMAKQREYREHNREKLRAKGRPNYAKNRQRILAQRKEKRRKKKDEKNAVVHISAGGDDPGGVLGGLGSGEDEPVGAAGVCAADGAAAADLLEPFKRGGDTP